MTPEKPFYKGPGAREWIFSFACSVLLATDAFIGRSAVLPHSSEGYYTKLGPAAAFHTIAVVVDAAVLLGALLWIVFPVLARPVKIGLFVLSLIGLSLFWFEIVFAVRHGSGPVFVLRELPFRPLANFGLLGAQVFATYLTFLIPSGRLPALQAVLVKAALAGCVFAYQSLVWDGIAHAFGRAP